MREFLIRAAYTTVITVLWVVIFIMVVGIMSGLITL
jgi:hypothetical protein